MMLNYQANVEGLFYPPKVPVTFDSMKSRGVRERVRDYHDVGSDVRGRHIIDISHDVTNKCFNDCTRKRYTGHSFVEVGGEGWDIIEADEDAIVTISKWLTWLLPIEGHYFLLFFIPFF
jgi:hypothetical protein